MLGIQISWKKGFFTATGHAWIGINYEIAAPGVAYMSLPPEYLESVAAALAPLTSKTGSTSVRAARTAVGKAARVAQVVPEAMPFAGSLSAALTASLRQAAGGRREAPPDKVANIRFACAARWFLTLIQGAVFPLRR